MEKVSWLQNGNEFKRVEGEFKSTERINDGIYNICYSPVGGWSLEKYAEHFEFGYKIYDLETKFIDYVIKTYKESTGNLGVLLNGVRGSGKTVTSKVLSNCLGLPIVLVKGMGDLNQAMIEYISKFNFDCVLLFDEFEKNFSGNDSTILQIMDGVYNENFRKVFLLTTNSLSVNPNLLDRPSRILYVKYFGNLKLDSVKEYLQDNLVDKDSMDRVIEFVDTLTISTIDILKSIVREINIHGIDEFLEAKGFLNVSSNQCMYSVVRGFLGYGSGETLKKEKGDLLDLFYLQANRYIEKCGLDNNTSIYPPDDVDDPNYAEKLKAYKDFRDYYKLDFGNVGIYTVGSSTKASGLKTGEDFDEATIIAVDHNRHLVITKDDNNDCYYFYMIKNPDAKPSLYKTNFDYNTLIL